MAGAEDEDASGRQGEASKAGERLLDKLLRHIGADVLDEPVPDRLRRVLRPGDGPDDGSSAGHGQGQPTRPDERKKGRNEPPG